MPDSDSFSALAFDALAQKIPYREISYQGVKLCIKRLDLVHPQISGNKFFKLKYNFLEAQRLGKSQLLTFGGAYSNHIAATAYAAHHFGLSSVGIIRGEELADHPLNNTLTTAQQLGMQLHFVSREQYRLKQTAEFLTQLQLDYPEHYVIPEGGTNALAIQGCKEILSTDDLENFDLFCCAVGTGGTITGLIEATTTSQHVLGFSALKGDFLTQEIQALTMHRHWQITDHYSCGGYAKTTPALLDFIRVFETEYQIPLDHIYTAKMFMGIFDWIAQAKFKPDQRILVLHSGGLQGRLSQIL